MICYCLKNKYKSLINQPKNSIPIWSITPSNAAEIISGQGTNILEVKFNPYVTATISVILQYDNSSYRKTINNTLEIQSSPVPIISDILMFQYCQYAGEYTLKADIENIPTSTIEWSCTGNAILYDVLYPYDAIFSKNINLYKAIDFYSTGNYDISLIATGNNAMSSYTKSFNITEAKAGFPLNFSPSTINLGGSTFVTLNEPETRSIQSESYKISFYKNTELVHQIVKTEKTFQLDLSMLSVGDYSVIVSGQNKTYFTNIKIIN